MEMGVFDFNDLKSRGLLPDNARVLKQEIVKQKCLPISVAKNMQTLNLGSIKNVVSDKVIWVAHAKGFGLYSCDGQYVYNYDNESFEFTTYFLKDKLIPINRLNLKEEIQSNFKEEKKMENNNIADALANLKSEIGGSAAPLAGTEVFATEGNVNADVKKQESAAKRRNLIDSLSSEIKDVSLADTKQMKIYNHEKSTIIGWITARDKKIRSLVQTKKATDNAGKFILKQGTPANVQNDFANKIKIDPKYFETQSSLKFKQDAPGPIKVAVLRLPVNGLVPVEDLRKANYKIDIDFKAPTDYVINYVNKNDLPFFINAYIGKAIKEDPRTHKNPSKLVVTTTVKAETDKETQLVNKVRKTSMKIESKKPLVQEGNYLPQVVYKTAPLSELASNNELRPLANISLFENIFSSTAKRARSWDKLPASDKEKVSNENGVITSKYLDPKVNLALDVDDCFTKAKITNPEIALKVKKEKKDGSGVRYVLDKYDVLHGGTENAELNPLTSERFANFVAACEGTLTVEKLRELVGKKSAGKTSGGSGNSYELDDEQALALWFKASEEGLTNISGNTKEFGQGRINEIGSEVYSILAKSN